jgi:hypothetical protein
MKHIVLLFTLLLLAGCSGKVSVTGKVTFSDDGKPLNHGIVFFESDASTLHAKINQDGTFQAGTVSQKDGIAKGKYRIRITLSDVADKSIPYDPESGKPQPRLRLIDPKYESASQSGLTIDVQGTTMFDIVVDRCPPNKEKFVR